MSQENGRKARWSLRIATGGRGFVQVKRLTGVLVRCLKCGRRSAALYRKFGSYSSAGVCYLKCRSCHEMTFVSDRLAANLLNDALPASDVQSLLPVRPQVRTPKVTPEQVEAYLRGTPASRRASLMVILVIWLVVVGAVLLLVLVFHKTLQGGAPRI